MNPGEFTHENVRTYMAAWCEELGPADEVDMTALAEGCASDFSQDDEGGPLDDSDHWIWELALDAHDAHDARRGTR